MADRSEKRFLVGTSGWSAPHWKLRGWAVRIEELSRDRIAYIYNNDWMTHAVHDAKTLCALLGVGGRERTERDSLPGFGSRG